MYCENCGAQVGENYRFCPSCGKPFSYSVIRPAGQRRSRVQDHIQLLAVLWIASGALLVLAAIALTTVAHTILAFALRPDLGVPGEVFPLVRTIIGFVALFIGLKGGAEILAGWGLLQRASWARPLTIVVAFLALLNIPIGTALGVYSLWVLLPEESARDYDHLAQAA
jgi:hypothetical protein